MSTGYETLSLVVEGGVATITVDRPKALNALNPQTVDELEAAVEAALTRLRAVGEDFQDQTGPVDDLHVPRAFKVALLHRRELAIEHRHLGLRLADDVLIKRTHNLVGLQAVGRRGGGGVPSKANG